MNSETAAQSISHDLHAQREPAAAREWRVSDHHILALDRPHLLGILNATPDSFSDGGRFLALDHAVAHAESMLDAGADIIDVGGESTRPGAIAITAEEQLARILPIIEALRRERGEVLISIDTTSSAVAEAALDAGATIINDVSAGRDDESMLPLAVSRRCGLILMHRAVRPSDDSYSDGYVAQPAYDDIARDVRDFLVQRAEAAQRQGVAHEAIVIDPGLGFGKSVEQNYELIRRSDELVATGYPVLSAASRKSFIGRAAGVDAPEQRDLASTALSVLHRARGVQLFRVHDVAMHRQALAVADAALRGNRQGPHAVE